MKNFFLSLLAITGLGLTAQAQVPVTFQVDMRAKVVSPLGLHIAGNLQSAAGVGNDWDPAGTQVFDADGDGIYEITLNLPTGTYLYKYVNGNAWGQDENAIPAPCNVGGNREVVVAGAMTVPVHAYGICDPNPAGNPVIFRVDMKNQTVGANGVHVAGNFQAAAGLPGDWDPATAALSDPDGDQMYEGVFWLNATGTYQYKFVNGNAWGSDEAVPAACAITGNRFIDVLNDSGYVTPNVCYGDCSPCPTGTVDTLYVAFAVDMRNALKKAGVLGTTQIAGNFQGWNSTANQMDDADGDSVYTTVIRLPESNIQYKFIHRPNCDNWEVGSNRQLTIAGNPNDTMFIPLVCYGEPGPCSPLPRIVNVTFRVDMNNEIIGPGGVVVAGDFQTPCNWVKNAIVMSDADGNGIYEVTMPIYGGQYGYKYFNGVSTDPTSDQYAESSNFDNLGCGANDFGHNRNLNLTNVMCDTLLPAFVFNECNITVPGQQAVPCNTSIIKGLAIGTIAITPNPFNNYTTVTLTNPTGIAYNFVLTNVAGQVVNRISNVRSEEVTIHKGNLPAGLYFLTIMNEKGERTSQKLVIE